MAKRLSREELTKVVENVIRPGGKGFTEEELNQQLLLFSINCPDPVGAMDLVIGARRGAAASELVKMAIAMPRRAVATLPE